MKLTAQHRKRESGHSGSHQQGSLRSTTSSRNPHFARPASTKKAASATRPERIHPPPFFLTVPCDNTRSPGAFTLAHSSVFNLQPSDRGEPALSREKGNHEKETKSEGNKRKMIVQVYSAVNLLWFLCNSAVINFCQFVLWLLVRPFDNALYRRVMGSFVQSLWVDVASSCFPEAKLVITGEVPTDTARPAIIIANHQVDADWWYIWQAARASRGAGNIKIVLKDQLKYVPIIGWGMRLFEFLFLRRSIDHDSVHIKAYMDSLIGDDYPFWLVIFPEGTTIHKEYVVKSQAFAEKLNRPKFERVLLPRTSGLQIILDAVGDVKPDIYDMTIAFPTYSGEVPTFEMGYGRKTDTGVPSMKSLLASKGPDHVAIHSKKFSYEEATENLEKFLDTRWREKEERLDFFIKNQKFPVKDEEVSVISLPSSIMSVFKLWFAMTLSFFLLPVVMMSFFPLYTIWVVYCFVYSIYDRTTNFWWPYILNLFLNRAAGFKSKM